MYFFIPLAEMLKTYARYICALDTTYLKTSMQYFTWFWPIPDHTTAWSSDDQICVPFWNSRG